MNKTNEIWSTIENIDRHLVPDILIRPSVLPEQKHRILTLHLRMTSEWGTADCNSVRPLFSTFQIIYNVMFICIQYPGWIISCFCFVFGRVRVHVSARNLVKQTTLIIPFGRCLAGIYDNGHSPSTLIEFLYRLLSPSLTIMHDLQFTVSWLPEEESGGARWHSEKLIKFNKLI